MNKAYVYSIPNDKELHKKHITLVNVMITGTLEVSNCRNSSLLTSTSGSSSDAALRETLTFGIPVSLKATCRYTEH